MPGRLEFSFSFGRPAEPAAPGRGPFRILLLADLGGEGGEPRIRPVDVDDIETLMGTLSPRLPVSAQEAVEHGSVPVIRSLEDLEPDALLDRLASFRELRGLRARLQDPATFAEAAAELRALVDAGAAPPGPGKAETAAPAPAQDEGTDLERLLGKPPTGPQGPAQRAAAGVPDLIRGLVAPYIVPEADPMQGPYVAAVDAAITERMRALLHDPGVQALEGAWRSLERLVRGLETGEDLAIHVADVSKAALAADVSAHAEALDESATYRLLAEAAAGVSEGPPWSLLVVCQRFSAAEQDMALLAALGAMAARLGAPLLADAHPDLLGVASLAGSTEPSAWVAPDDEGLQAWNALRRSAVAPWIGLALPRVLTRLPYGEGGEPVEGFDFDELGGTPRHEDLPWGSAACACALLLGKAFEARGWSMEPGDVLDVEDLPAYVREIDGERRLQPCAEVLLSERAAEAILRRGLMPLMSYRDRNAARLLRFQSIADPPRPLAGPWS